MGLGDPSAILPRVAVWERRTGACTAAVGVITIAALGRSGYLAIGFAHTGSAAAGSAILGALWVDVLWILASLFAMRLAERCGRLVPLVKAPIVAAFLWIALARIADLVCFYLSGGHVDAAALLATSVFADVVRLDLRGKFGVLVALVLATVAAALWLRFLKQAEPRRDAIRLGSLAFGCLLVRGVFLVTAEPSAVVRLRPVSVVPEVRILEAFATLLERRDARVGPLLHPVVKKKLRRFGVSVDGARRWPFERVLHEPALPFARSERWTARPSVVVVFLGSAAATTRNGTQAWQRFLGYARIVDGFVGPDRPGIREFLAALTGYSPVHARAAGRPLGSHLAKDRPNLRGLAEPLAERGWSTAWLGPSTTVATSERFVRVGFAEVDLFHDAGAMFQDAWRRVCASRPVLLGVQGVEFDAPAAHSAFLRFWDRLRRSQQKNRTIVVLVGGSQVPSDATPARGLPGERSAGSTFGPMLFAVFDPRYRLQGRSHVLSGFVDVAPTILHLLGIEARMSAEGRSVFGSRRWFPGVLGTAAGWFATLQPVDGDWALDLFGAEDVRGVCSDPALIDPSLPMLTRCERWTYAQWKNAIELADRVSRR